MTSISGISAISGAYSVRFPATQRPERRPGPAQEPARALEPVAKAVDRSTDEPESRPERGDRLDVRA
ncbi:hypothetical protein [Dactylosporangium sp. NPDC051541]|uniref:hypothetical protein n=1 Tax=Dactylosporangium sp. NPDC051541 TaxID=3363977 RepID=UPI0037AE9FE1